MGRRSIRPSPSGPGFHPSDGPCRRYESSISQRLSGGNPVSNAERSYRGVDDQTQPPQAESLHRGRREDPDRVSAHRSGSGDSRRLPWRLAGHTPLFWRCRLLFVEGLDLGHSICISAARLAALSNGSTRYEAPAVPSARWAGVKLAPSGWAWRPSCAANSLHLRASSFDWRLQALAKMMARAQ